MGGCTKPKNCESFLPITIVYYIELVTFGLHPGQSRAHTNSSAVGLNGHAAVLLFEVLVSEQDPSRVVVAVQSHRSTEVDDGVLVVTSQAVEVTKDRARLWTIFVDLDNVLSQSAQLW